MSIFERIGAYAYAKCFKVDYVNVQFTLQPVSKHDQEDPEYMKSTAEVEKSKTEQEVMKAQVSKTQAETSKTKAEIGKTKAEADKTSADAQAIRSGKTKNSTIIFCFRFIGWNKKSFVLHCMYFILKFWRRWKWKSPKICSWTLREEALKNSIQRNSFEAMSRRSIYINFHPCIWMLSLLMPCLMILMSFVMSSGWIFFFH